ncbi:LysR family transcriptional regulator [Acuticoccus mangrovi]|uniref:LysR family transcriptional regulator n=1 Tax=Acuticoccus mangrovi TaxID=2796142 RepID=A0A934IS20_9HYPH|nr:LysR family transcriptional regulator [Acuticoccus mangrovi]MBJ3777000.1 LysR family transcriptional regulator [Acuticoccus mangrovi]
MARQARRLDQLNLNLLRTFSVIAEEQGLTRAAERLSIRQPSVTLALQRLEEQLGCQLVHRDSRRFALTAAGQRVYLECQDILRSLGRIEEATREVGDETGGEIRLLIVSNLSSPLIDEAIRLVHSRHPAISWTIEVETSHTIVRQVQQERAGLGICLLTRPVVNLDCRLLFREAFSVLCGAEHPFYGRHDVPISELQQEAFVAFTCATEGPGLEPMAVLSEGAGLGSRVAASSPNLEEVRRLIILGVGIGILPLTAVSAEIERGLLWSLAVPDQALGADVFLVTNPDVGLSAAEQQFVAAIEELTTLYPELAV